MSEKMKALAKLKPGPGLELIETDIPKIKKNEILIKVKVTSVCGSDLHIYKWDKWSQDRVKTPRITGHELAGEVVEVGSEVSHIKVGDFISAESHIVCNHCYLCKTGQYHICRDFKILGVDIDGVFAEYAAIPEICAWKNDDDFDKDLASIQEPFGNAVQTAYVDELVGKNVAIFGLGPIGLFCIPLVEVAGANKIFVIDVNDYKLSLAKKLSQNIICLDARKDNIIETIMAHTEGLGADVALEVSGNGQAIKTMFNSIRNGGRISLLGIPSNPVEINLAEQIVLKGVNVFGITGRKMFDTWYKTSRLLKSGKVNIKPVITHSFQLDEYEKAFNTMIEGNCGKIIMYP